MSMAGRTTGEVGVCVATFDRGLPIWRRVTPMLSGFGPHGGDHGTGSVRLLGTDAQETDVLGITMPVVLTVHWSGCGRIGPIGLGGVSIA